MDLWRLVPKKAETGCFYKDLFSNKDSVDQEIYNFLGQEHHNSCPKISEAQKDKTKGLITVEELTKYIKKTKEWVAKIASPKKRSHILNDGTVMPLEVTSQWKGCKRPLWPHFII